MNEYWMRDGACHRASASTLRIMKTAAVVSSLAALVLLAARPVDGQGLDRETAAALGNAPPTTLKACVLGGSGPTACPPEHGTEPPHRIRLEWKPPILGTVAHYEVYRYRVVTGNPLRDLPTRVALCGTSTTSSCGASSATTFVDGEELPKGSNFVYYVVAEFDDRTRSGPSNFTIITAVD